jgi:hypothetical protein
MTPAVWVAKDLSVRTRITDLSASTLLQAQSHLPLCATTLWLNMLPTSPIRQSYHTSSRLALPRPHLTREIIPLPLLEHCRRVRLHRRRLTYRNLMLYRPHGTRVKCRHHQLQEVTWTCRGTTFLKHQVSRQRCSYGRLTRHLST